MAALLCLSSRPAAGQTRPAPRTAGGKADLSGLWSPDRNFIVDITSALKPGETLPLQPWALKVAKERMSKDDPEANCLPAGVPRMAPYPWRILQPPARKDSPPFDFGGVRADTVNVDRQFLLT